MLTSDTIGLSCTFEKVIYKGKEFSAPVNILVLMSWDYIIYLLKNKQI